MQSIALGPRRFRTAKYRSRMDANCAGRRRDHRHDRRAALMGDWFGRRMASLPLLRDVAGRRTRLLPTARYVLNASFLIWAFIMGTTTASFYGWLPLYLPELFPTRVRATGQGFGFNFGRIIAAIGILQVGAAFAAAHHGNENLATGVKGGYPVACSYVERDLRHRHAA